MALNMGAIKGSVLLNVANFKKGIQEANTGVKGFASQTGKSFSQLEGAIASAGITAGLYAIAGKAIQSSASLATLKNQTGATGAELEALKGSIDNVMKSGISGDKAAVTKALTVMKAETKLTGEELENATKKALIFEKDFGISAEESGRAVRSMMTQFNIGADEAFDVMTKVRQESGDSYGDLADSFNEYSKYYEELGFNAEEFGNILVTGQKQGVMNFDRVGDSFKGLQDMVGAGSKSVKTAFDELGLNYEEYYKRIGKGDTKALYEVMNAIGEVENKAKRVDLQKTLLTGVGEDLTAGFMQNVGKGEVGSSKGKSDAIVKNTEQSMEAEMNKLKVQFNEMIIPLGTSLIGVINKLMPVLEPLFKMFQKIFEIPGVGEIVVVLMGLLAAFAAISAVVAPIISVVGSLGAVFGLLLNPIGLAIAALIALGALFTWLWKNDIGGFKTGLKSLWKEFKKVFEKITSFVGEVYKIFKKDGPQAAFKMVYDKIKEYAGEFLKFFVDNILKFTGPFGMLAHLFLTNKDKILSILTGLKLGFKNVIDSIISGFLWFINAQRLAIMTFINIITGWKNTVITTITNLKNNIVTKFWEIVNAITAFGTSMFEAGKSLIQNIIDGFNNLIGKPKEIISGLFTDLGTTVANGWNALKEMITGGANDISYNATAESQKQMQSQVNEYGRNTYNIDASRMDKNQLQKAIGEKMEDDTNAFVRKTRR